MRAANQSSTLAARSNEDNSMYELKRTLGKLQRRRERDRTRRQSESAEQRARQQGTHYACARGTIG